MGHPLLSSRVCMSRELELEMGPGSLLRDAGVPRGIFMAGAGSVAVCVEPCRGRSRSWPGADDALSSLLFRSSCSMSGAFLAPGDAVVGTGIPHSVELPLGSASEAPTRSHRPPSSLPLGGHCERNTLHALHFPSLSNRRMSPGLLPPVPAPPPLTDTLNAL